MSQIKAMTHREPRVTLSVAERKRLDVWPQDDGWCSACSRGQDWGTRSPIAVVHLGSKKKAVDVAFCGPCIERMHATLHKRADSGKGNAE